MLMTKRSLIKYISKKIANHIVYFDSLPDLLIISPDDYEMIKDNNFIKTLRIIIEERLDRPIVLKK